MTTHDVLLQAADLIEREGWWDGRRPGPLIAPRCAMTALDITAQNGTRLLHAEHAMRRHIGLSAAGSLAIGGPLAVWNDRQPDGTTVVAALRACAASLKG